MFNGTLKIVFLLILVGDTYRFLNSHAFTWYKAGRLKNHLGGGLNLDTSKKQRQIFFGFDLFKTSCHFRALSWPMTPYWALIYISPIRGKWPIISGKHYTYLYIIGQNSLLMRIIRKEIISKSSIAKIFINIITNCKKYIYIYHYKGLSCINRCSLCQIQYIYEPVYRYL